MYIESMMPSNHLSLFLLLQSFPASGSFPVSRLFISGDQSIGASASALVFPMNIQDWFALGLTGWISLQSKELERVFSNTTLRKHQFFSALPSWWSNSYIRTWLLEKSRCCDLYFYVLSPKLRAQTGRERNKKKNSEICSTSEDVNFSSWLGRISMCAHSGILSGCNPCCIPILGLGGHQMHGPHFF